VVEISCCERFGFIYNGRVEGINNAGIVIYKISCERVHTGLIYNGRVEGIIAGGLLLLVLFYDHGLSSIPTVPSTFLSVKVLGVTH
jgi:hypothetical protein